MEFRAVVAVHLGAVLKLAAGGGRFSAVSAAIEGLLPARLASPDAPCDISQDFAAFGLMPMQHSTLDIMLPESLRQPIAALLLLVEWGGLPTDKQGFAGHYRGYRTDIDGHRTTRPLFDNRSFRVAFAMSEAARWRLERMPARPLFRTVGGGAEPRRSAPVMPVSRFVLPVESDWGMGANAGELTLRMTLVEPPCAFGNSLYAPAVLAATMRRTPLPNPPWLPIIRRLTLGYYPR